MDELCHQLGDIIQAGFLKRSEGERLRGDCSLPADNSLAELPEATSVFFQITSKVAEVNLMMTLHMTLHALRQINELIRANQPRKLYAKY